MEKFVQEYSYIAYILIFVVEHLIASSKLEANSSIELILSVLRNVFGIKKK